MSTSNERRTRREISRDARALVLAQVRAELEAEYRKVYAFSRLPGILKRGILSGLTSSIRIVERKQAEDGQDQSVRDRTARPSEGEGG